MAQNGYLFVQPLLSADDAWAGYRAEFAPGCQDNEILGQLLSGDCLTEFDQRHPWLFPAAEGLGGDSRHVWLFPAHPEPQHAALEAALRQQRTRVGLVAAADVKLPATGTWDFLLIAASHARSLPPYTLIGQASRTAIIGTSVQSQNDRHWLIENGATLTSAEFLLTRATDGEKADTTRVKLLRLLALISEDADTPALEAVFKEEPKLSYSLLRLVNSAAVAPRSPITSFAQAINLLGRRQLQRWLQLLVYADPNNGAHPNPLLQFAAARGRLLELLIGRVPQAATLDNAVDAAFMTGTFSLLDVLLKMPLTGILQQLPLGPAVNAALSDHADDLGSLLLAIKQAAEGRLDKAGQKLAELGIIPADFLQAQCQALAWAARIHVGS